MRINLLWILLTPMLLTAQPKEQTDTLITDYFNTYQQLDFAKLKTFYTADTVFTDRTMPYMARFFGAPEAVEQAVTGGDQIATSLEQGFTGTEKFDIRIKDRMIVGELAVVSGTMIHRMKGTVFGMPDKTMDFTMDFTTVFKVKDGKVVEHTSHIDYDAVARQFLEQGGVRPPAAAQH